MLDALIVIFAIIGTVYGIKEASLFARIRNWVMMRSTFMAKLLMCYFCSGFWAGLIVYLLYVPQPWLWTTGLLWALAGSAISGLFDALYNYLTLLKTN